MGNSTLFGENFTRWDSLFQQYATQFNIPFDLPKAICMIESALGCNFRVAHGILNPYDVIGSCSSDTLSWGLMQLEPGTAQAYDPAATAVLLNNPEYSIKIGCQHLGHLSEHLGGAEEWTVKAYNAGLVGAKRERDGLAVGRTGNYWPKYLTAKDILMGAFPDNPPGSGTPG